MMESNKDVFVYRVYDGDAVAAYNLKEAHNWYTELTGIPQDELDSEIVPMGIKVWDEDQQRSVTVHEIVQAEFKGEPTLILSTEF